MKRTSFYRSLRVRKGAPVRAGRLDFSQSVEGQKDARAKSDFVSHESKSGPDAKLFRNGKSRPAKHYLGHALIENRHGLLVQSDATQAAGKPEHQPALLIIATMSRLLAQAYGGKAEPQGGELSISNKHFPGLSAGNAVPPRGQETGAFCWAALRTRPSST
jgi:hypothetical protein